MYSYEENNEAYREHFAKSIQGYGFYVIMTIRCNYSCSICSYSAQHTCDDSWNISYEVIDAFAEKLKAFKDCEIKPVICLYGGEPTLELDKCEYLANKVHELGFKVSMFTNCWWGSNQEIRKRIHEKIKPYLLFMSVDKYHDNDIQKNIIPIIEEFKNDTFTIPCAFKHDPKIEQLKQIYSSLKTHEDEIFEMGRATHNDDPNIIKTSYGSCHKVAVAVKPNGDIGFDCCHDLKTSCNFATVFDDFVLTNCTKEFKYFHTFPNEWWCDDNPDFNCCDTQKQLPPGVQRIEYYADKEFKCSNLKYSDLRLK